MPYMVDDEARSNSTYLASVQQNSYFKTGFDEPGAWGYPVEEKEGTTRIPHSKHLPAAITEKHSHGTKDKYPIGHL